METITLNGKVYIASRLAAKLAGYAQDYVGQLCRMQKLDATRVGRVWYVTEESILNHKKTAEQLLSVQNRNYSTYTRKTDAPAQAVVATATVEAQVVAPIAAPVAAAVVSGLESEDVQVPTATGVAFVQGSVDSIAEVVEENAAATAVFAVEEVLPTVVEVAEVIKTPAVVVEAPVVVEILPEIAPEPIVVEVVEQTPVVEEVIAPVEVVAPIAAPILSPFLFADIDAQAEAEADELAPKDFAEQLLFTSKKSRRALSTALALAILLNAFTFNNPEFATAALDSTVRFAQAVQQTYGAVNQVASLALRQAGVAEDEDLAGMSRSVVNVAAASFFKNGFEAIASNSYSLINDGVNGLSAFAGSFGTRAQNMVASTFTDSIRSGFASLFGRTAPQTTRVVVYAPVEKAAPTVQLKTIAAPKQTAVISVKSQPAVVERIVNNRLTERVTERVTERIVGEVTQADLDSRINELYNKMQKQFSALSTGNGGSVTNLYQTIANMQRIDTLSGVAITNSTFTGGTIEGLNGLSVNGNISGNNISANGQLTISGTATSTIAGDVAFDSDTLFIDSVNNRVGVGTSSPSDTFAVNGPVYLTRISAPAVTTNRLYNVNGLLYFNGTPVGSGSGGGGADGNWVFFNESGIRLATTTNQVVIGALASSTNATLEVNGSGYFANNVGIGTATPGQKLSVAGDILGNRIIGSSFTGTSTATSTFTGGLATNLLNVTSTTASSTFANGINLTAGCFSINGTCVGTGSGSGTVSSGTIGQQTCSKPVNKRATNRQANV
jgi:hypothetical protein